MLIEMPPDMPDMVDMVPKWPPKTYQQYFEGNVFYR
tara:strand:- start:319 stop:426 length:108 start_codon:yes stop_codon:yes gene_type:complete